MMMKRHRAKENGTILVMTLIVGTPLMIVSGALLAVLVNHQKEVEQRVGISNARSIAASGAHQALAVLADDDSYQGSYKAVVNGGIAVVTVAEWESDGVDNDGDGAIDDADEQDVMSVSSVGWVNPTFDMPKGHADKPVRTYQSEVEVILERTPTTFGVNQAIYIDDPMADFDISGNAFLFSGFDYMMDGSLNPNGTAMPAIGVPGDPSFITNQLRTNQTGNVEGKGGTPSIVTVDPVDMGSVIDILKSRAAIVWDSADSYDGELGTTTEPIVAWAKDDLTLQGKVIGAGVLIVEGDLVIKGAFDFDGLILAMESVEFNGGGTAKDIAGALMCLGAVAGRNIDVTGDVSITYSSEAIDMVNQAGLMGPGYEVVAWIQK